MCYETFVLICHCGGTCLIRILYPKKSKKPKTACSLFLNLTIYALEVQMCYTLLFTSVYNHVQLWSLIYCLLWLIKQIHDLNGYCTTWMIIIYVQNPFFDVNSTAMSIW